MIDPLRGPAAPAPGGIGRPKDALAALRSGRIQDPEVRLRTAATLLEGSFYEELFKAMRATVPASADGAGARASFEGMLDQSLAESAAGRAQRGLSFALYRSLGGTADPGEPPPGGTP